jgi:hypothetical protein
MGAIDESKLTPSEKVMLGIYKANAGNQLDGELAFMRSKAPFGNWAPKTRAEIRAEEAEREKEMAESEVERLENERLYGRLVTRYEQPSIFGRIWNMFYCGLWYSIWYTVPIAAFVVHWIFGVDDNERALLISLPIAASIGIVRGFFRRKEIYERLPVGE